MVRALASHQCGPGSIPGPGVICGLSLLLVLVPVPRVFLRVLRFSSLHKNQHFQIPIRSGIRGPQVCQSRDCYVLPTLNKVFIIIIIKLSKKYNMNPRTSPAVVKQTLQISDNPLATSNKIGYPKDRDIYVRICDILTAIKRWISFSIKRRIP